jgi:site-specific recombinase XerD
MTIDLYATLSTRRQSAGYVFLDADGQPFDEKRLARRLAEARKKAGLRHFGWHTLRHTFASHLAMSGASLAAIQQLMGHSMITTTMRYAHLAPSTLRANTETRL